MFGRGKFWRVRFGRNVESLDAGLPRSLDVDICRGIGMNGLRPKFATGNKPKSQELLREAI
jgi:hypothetical protein